MNDVVLSPSVWRHLNAVPNFVNWRRNRINEIEGFESELGDLRDELIRNPCFHLWIKACERTRFYWSRFHAVAVTGCLPPRLERSGYEFLKIMGEILALRERIIAASDWEKDRSESYSRSMEIRCLLVKTRLELGIVQVRQAIWKELPGGTAYQFNDDWTASVGSKDQLTILCGCYWTIAHKLDSWRLELEREEGPYAHCIRNHHELILGSLQLFRLILKTAEPLGCIDELKQAQEFSDRLRCQLLEPLAYFWAEINAHQAIPEDELLGFHDLALSHPMEDQARAKVLEWRMAVVPFANEAEDRFKKACRHISPQDWLSWENLAFEERLEFELPEDPPLKTPIQWTNLIAHVLNRLEEINSRDGLQQLCFALIKFPNVEPNEKTRAGNLVALIGRLLELDFSGTIGLVRQRLLADAPTQPSAFYELQLVGHVLRTVRRATNRNQAEEHLCDLVTGMIQTDAARWGRVEARNAIMARLLAACFVVASDDIGSIERLWTIGKECVKLAEGDPHFFQTLAKDVLRLLGQHNSGLGKTFLLARLVPPNAVRWPDRLEKLAVLWRTDLATAMAVATVDVGGLGRQ